VEIEKLQIISDNRGKTSIYMWIHLKSGRKYIGSALDLSKRLLYYFSPKHLDRNKSMYICRALKDHGYGEFSLSILEYINISDLSIEQTKDLVISREQFYIDSLSPEYNLL
jgi:group I intron endonuclease